MADYKMLTTKGSSAYSEENWTLSRVLNVLSTERPPPDRIVIEWNGGLRMEIEKVQTDGD